MKMIGTTILTVNMMVSGVALIPNTKNSACECKEDKNGLTIAVPTCFVGEYPPRPDYRVVYLTTPEGEPRVGRVVVKCVAEQ
jgi:hypothetical protein